MTTNSLVETKAAVKFSDMTPGQSGWVMLAGIPTAVIKTKSSPWGAMMSNARKIGGRNGKTFVATEATAYPTSGECKAAFEAKRQAYLSRNEQQERPYMHSHPANGYL